jgi:hypothetical protein
MHPMREWLVGISVVFIGVALGALLGIYLYRTYEVKSEAEMSITETAVPYQAAKIAEALLMYNAKKSVYEGILTGTTILIPADPAVATNTSPIPTLVSAPVVIVDNLATTTQLASTTDTNSSLSGLPSAADPTVPAQIAP